MNNAFIIGYFIISLVMATADAQLAARSFGKGNIGVGRPLGWTGVFGTLVVLSYLFSIASQKYFLISLFSSIYFMCIDWMLFNLIKFAYAFTNRGDTKIKNAMLKAMFTYACFESVVFAINTVKEIAISYELRPERFLQSKYIMKPLFFGHLAFTYTMVIAVIIIFIYKIHHTPRHYKNQYKYIVYGILIIVAFNGFFLLLQGQMLDYSTLCYSCALAVMYWSCFMYGAEDMLKEMSKMIFDDIDQGILLFDYDGYFVMINDKAKSQLRYLDSSTEIDMKSFVDIANIQFDSHANEPNFSTICYSNPEKRQYPLRCDYNLLQDKKGATIGHLFTFADAILETDLLTGFHNWESFQIFARQEPENFKYPTSVVSFDINSLSNINSTYGKEVGDIKIGNLAESIKKHMPMGSYFVRGQDACLIALCGNTDENTIKQIAIEIEKDQDIQIQYGISSMLSFENTVIDAISRANDVMQMKKLIDTHSLRSQMLSSLVRALQESDSDTEAHVKRTERNGTELGKKIGLTDRQQSKLSLLCLLHDIGKIGIPLEILNKPGKLTGEEWETLKTHVEKGYQIALSNQRLSGIADEILHHHERWDGNGYPAGLAGENIPILSRIIAVVDAYDAMVNDRSYRRAISPEDAMAEIKRCAGTQFDPFIADEFIKMLEENPALAKGEIHNDVVVPVAPQEPGILGKTGRNNTHIVKFSRYIVDEAGYIVMVDENFESITGYTEQDVKELRMTQVDMVPKEDQVEYYRIATKEFESNSTAYIEHYIMCKDGKKKYVFCCGKRYYDSAAKQERTEIIIADSSNTYSAKITSDRESSKAKQSVAQWEKSYRNDPLTGLLTYRSFRHDVSLQLSHANKQVMMVAVDMDNFKLYNDKHGRQAGDEVLIMVGQLLRRSLRRYDYACHLGGDEFMAALFFDKNTDKKILSDRAKQIFDKVNMTLMSKGDNLGVSMGVAICQNADLSGFDDVYKTADEALQKSKADGKGIITVKSNY